MQKLMTLLSGASLGASGMYLMDPDRGHRRRAELRDKLAEVDTGELIERARGLEPVRTLRQLRGGMGPIGAMGALLEPGRWMAASRAPRWMATSRGTGWGRRRSLLQARDWAMLGGLVGAIAAGLWLARRWSSAGEGIEVVRTMAVEAPVERVYEFWSDFENFPRFMSHVREVKRTAPTARTGWWRARAAARSSGTPSSPGACPTRRSPGERSMAPSWSTPARCGSVPPAATIRRSRSA
jgi:hypothetical protein